MSASAQIWALDANRASLSPSDVFVAKLLNEKPAFDKRLTSNYRLHGIEIDSAPVSVKSIMSMNPVTHFTKTKFYKKAKDHLDYFHHQQNEQSFSSIEQLPSQQNYNYRSNANTLS